MLPFPFKFPDLVVRPNPLSTHLQEGVEEIVHLVAITANTIFEEIKYIFKEDYILYSCSIDNSYKEIVSLDKRSFLLLKRIAILVQANIKSPIWKQEKGLDVNGYLNALEAHVGDKYSRTKLIEAHLIDAVKDMVIYFDSKDLRLVSLLSRS